MPLKTARHYAEKIREWLAPYAVRIEIAGSIRRERPWCGDVDLVVIPKCTEYPDLLGNITTRENHLHRFLQDYVKDRNPFGVIRGQPKWVSGGEVEGKQAILELPKCQLDLWFADERTWGTRLLCRTGSKQHNIWFAERANSRGLHWDPYAGLGPLSKSSPAPVTPTEESLYHALGLELIPPPCREPEWIAKHIEFGL